EFPPLPGYVLAKRAVFILDKNGKIVYKWVGKELANEPNYAEIEEVVRKLK
ncbi:MAG: peroxiredoxin, partial [Metallosphaera sp.]